MSHPYEHILTPLRIGNVVLRNRLFSAPMGLHCLQGGEPYPTPAIIAHYAQKARGGAAVVTCSGTRAYSTPSDGSHISYDLYSGEGQHYLSQMADAIHFYGAKASMEIAVQPRDGAYQASAGNRVMGPGNMISKEITEEAMQEAIENLQLQVTTLKRLGFDMILLHIAYNMGLLGSFISTRLNRRTDEYGGPIENRVRFLNRCCDAVHEAAGKDFLVELRMSGELPPEEGFTIEDACRMAKAIEGHVDLLQVHAPTEWQAHPMSFEKHLPNLWMAEEIKKSGAKIVTAPIGGFQDLDDIESYIAEGRTDMIGVGRAFICDSRYGEKIAQGRGDDVVPCVRCNRCHGLGMQGPWKSVCTVNPEVGIQHRLHALVQPGTGGKKVAVIGGGPAGMRAALYLKERGHSVTLFEKTGKLGGQLIHADYSSFKWPLRDYKDYLIAQLEKCRVEVRLNSAATPEMIQEEGFDAVIAAMGAVPKLPPVPGLTDDSGKAVEGVYDPIEVYGREQELGKKVVVIGGGEIGMETAMYLAENGHEVTILSRQRKFAADADRVHYYSMFADAWSKMDNLTPVKRATTTAVAPGQVTYTDKNGESHTITCDSIVACGGMAPVQEEALAFADAADTFLIIGDNETTGNVMTATRSAFAAAMRI